MISIFIHELIVIILISNKKKLYNRHVSSTSYRTIISLNTYSLTSVSSTFSPSQYTVTAPLSGSARNTSPESFF